MTAGIKLVAETQAISNMQTTTIFLTENKDKPVMKVKNQNKSGLMPNIKTKIMSTSMLVNSKLITKN